MPTSHPAKPRLRRNTRSNLGPEGVAPPRVRPSTAALVLLACGANALVTTVHHVRGALHYGTPGRYHAVVIAAVVYAIAAAAYAASRSGGDRGTFQHFAWWVFWVTSFLGFVVAFGLVEGLFTHVIAPIVGGYSPDEPFDLLFQVTGVLHVVPAAVTAVLLIRLLRQRRDAG
jgi:hypothetical protein